MRRLSKISLSSLLVLGACGHQLPARVTNQPEAIQADPEDITDEDEMMPPMGALHIHVRGSGQSGLVLSTDGADPVFIASGSDFVFTTAVGKAVTLSGEPAARLNTGGARVRSWGASECKQTDKTCTLTLQEGDRDVTVVQEEIVYIGRYNDTDNVYALSFDGTVTRALTKLEARDVVIETPKMSPNGQWLVYVSNRALAGDDAKGPAKNLWLMPANGGDSVALTKSLNDDSGNPSWSADSKTIVFTKKNNVWKLDLSSKEAKALTGLSNARAGNASLSHDGATLAYLSNRKGDGSDAASDVYRLWLANADGSDAHWVSDIPAADGVSAAFSTDDQMLAFVGCDNLSCTLASPALVRVDGGLARKLASVADRFSFATSSTHLFSLTPTSLLKTPWVNLDQPLSTPLGQDTPVMLATGDAGTLLVTERVDNTVPASEWRLRGVGFTMDKVMTPGSIRAIVLTP
jgi:WD40-like Beta Propeller Repeat